MRCLFFRFSNVYMLPQAFLLLRVCSRVLGELEIWVFETIYSRDARHFEYISLQLGSHSGRSLDDGIVLYFFLDFFLYM